MTDCEASLGEKPKRPLSAYNLFFQNERKKLLHTLPTRPQGKPRHSHGKCGFANMAKIIAKKWKNGEIDAQDRVLFEQMAQKERLRYKREMSEYKKQKLLALKSRKKNHVRSKEIQLESGHMLDNSSRSQDGVPSSELISYSSLVSFQEQPCPGSSSYNADEGAPGDGRSVSGQMLDNRSRSQDDVPSSELISYNSLVSFQEQPCPGSSSYNADEGAPGDGRSVSGQMLDNRSRSQDDVPSSEHSSYSSLASFQEQSRPGSSSCNDDESAPGDGRSVSESSSTPRPELSQEHLIAQVSHLIPANPSFPDDGHSDSNDLRIPGHSNLPIEQLARNLGDECVKLFIELFRLD